ncbi:GNAT family N-acetyltransferase [Sedimentibacter sp. zth1]|uniref:GNAT family N-acetyltransferase n=1 Tax=Sedimentibacter sp. zth1 TaxID=2816908 RepID=UPI001A936873|nr:GNAT family N-acetyltransferase [Sedimentibacter sp. zth1]QSX05122.1 GNAT family N-acetyltransferase [Sedimentibacter sp. zth1]
MNSCLKLEKLNINNMTEEQTEIVCTFVRKINSSAASLFKKAVNEKLLKCCFLFTKESNVGVMTIIEDKDYISVQISFEKDVCNFEAIKYIHQAIKSAINSKESKELYLNVNGYNTVIINYFRNYGFVQSDYGYGFEFSLKSSEQKIADLMNFKMEESLEFRKFEDRYGRNYLDLLEDAFREQSEMCNEKTTIGDEHIPWLKEFDIRGEFGALWKSDNLIGLYTLNGNYIDHIAVLSKYKGKGYGNIILNYCLKYMFINKNYDECNLCTYKINYKAQKLYLKNGFRVTSFYCENEYKE